MLLGKLLGGAHMMLGGRPLCLQPPHTVRQMIALSTGCVMTSRSPVAFPQLSNRCPAGQFDVSCASSGWHPLTVGRRCRRTRYARDRAS